MIRANSNATSQCKEFFMSRSIQGRAAQWLLGAAVAVVVVLAGCATTPDTRSGTQTELRMAETTLQDFRNDPDMRWFRDHIRDARAIVIAPNITRAGFVFGGSGGEAVVFYRERPGAPWVGPAFYNMGAGSVGFQFGVDVSQVVVLALTERAANALLSPKFTLGGDVSIAVGPVGAGAATSVTTDFVSFARSKGLYAGVSLGGAVIAPDNGANAAYYGRSTTPVDILVRHTVTNPDGRPISQMLAQMSGR
jgi:lipid-binding SYLF domain-containing protein